MVFMISYDLHSPTNNREKVQESIKSLGSWCKYLTTTFLVRTNFSAAQVQLTATKFLDDNDKMIIAEVNKPILGQLSTEQFAWIKSNL